MNGARDRLEAVLDRLEARQADERVFTTIYAMQARAAADAAEVRHREGRKLGPLDGLIVSIKDLFDVAGEPTRAGSQIRKNVPAARQDAIVVRRLREAGAVVLGKTAMTEFAFTAVGDNPHFGMPGNAADPQRIPGGSSSGAGVSAGEGTSDIAIGTDTGGSVRIPAALNGVVGFKPTASRVPRQGCFPLSDTLDSIGPLARSVRLCAAADAVMAGEAGEALDPMSLAGLRLAVPGGLLTSGLEPPVAAAFEDCLRRLERGGVKLADCRIEDLLHGMREATRQASIASLEAARLHADWLTDADRVARVDPHVAGPLSRAMALPPESLAEALRRRSALCAAMDGRLKAWDVLALPTVPILAPPAAPVLADDRLWNETDTILLRNPQTANQFDLTAISLPMPGPALPAGLMLVARRGADRRLLAIAAAVERLLQGGAPERTGLGR